MRVIPEHTKARWTMRYPTDKVNSIGNSALYCSKKFEGNFQLSCKRKGDKYERKHGLSCRYHGAVNVNIGPVVHIKH